MIKRLWQAALDRLSSAVDKLQAAWPTERLVKQLAPVFSAAAGAATTWLAAHFPGLPPIGSEYLAGIFALATGGCYATINKIIDGWQQKEAREHDAAQAAEQRASDERIAALQSPSAAHAVGDAKEAAAQRVVAEASASAAAAGPSSP